MPFRKLVVAAVVALAPLGCAQAQQAGADSTPTETGLPSEAKVSGNTITIPGRAKGYTGIEHGGSVTLAPDGTARWADYPTIKVVRGGSPAHKVGLAAGDVILSVNGKDGRESGLLSSKVPGQTFVIRVRRGEEIREYTITSISRPTTN